MTCVNNLVNCVMEESLLVPLSEVLKIIQARIVMTLHTLESRANVAL